MDEEAMREVLRHAAESPEVEICGVLVGELCADGHGPFLQVAATVRGERAREQGAQVTFTHETWDHIHRTIDARHRGLSIVGWYHTHPGFDVFLSEMDAFIHENFFPQPFQVALVHDPLAGRTAVFSRQGGRLEPLARFWCGGRSIALAGAEPASERDALLRELADVRREVARLGTEIRAAGRESVLDRWITPGLLILIVALLVFQFLMVPWQVEQGLLRLILSPSASPVSPRDAAPRPERSPARPADPAPPPPR
jgi:proteasome lid subunit RPN8/RPN11